VWFSPFYRDRLVGERGVEHRVRNSRTADGGD
jgi:hypothetical protein